LTKSSTSLPLAGVAAVSDEVDRTKEDASASERSSCSVVACRRRIRRNCGVKRSSHLLAESNTTKVSCTPGRPLSAHAEALPISLLMTLPVQTRPLSPIVVCIARLGEPGSVLISMAHERRRGQKAGDANALAIVSFASPTSAWL
jgi:hypothetical protein